MEVFPITATPLQSPLDPSTSSFPIASSSSSSASYSLTTPPRSRRRSKKNTADSCIRRLCASHQGDIELLCDLWSSPSQNADVSRASSPILALTHETDEPMIPQAELERHRLLQLEMQLMRMQLQQAELNPTPVTPPLLALTFCPSSPSLSEPKPSANVAESPQCLSPPARRTDLRIPLDEDLTQSIQIAQEEHQNLLWAEADYRAQKLRVCVTFSFFLWCSVLMSIACWTCDIFVSSSKNNL